MKTFSDLLATKPFIDLWVDISSVSDNGAPHCRISLNENTVYNDRLHGRFAETYRVDLLTPIKLCIEMRDKIYDSERDTGLMITQISIDGMDIVPNWTHLASYTNDHGASGPTSYIGYNGIWCFEIPEPFYRWRHRVTGQGWLLEPRAVFRDCAASSANTNDGLAHNGAGNIVAGKDPIQH